ncbi:GDNF family receptor alpha-2-like, partial [Cyprinodon tularosa]|uniref:GDNF family receptor alpha-2-like n=1 Tax=Cyprinodon tularosa TaxID=77115 RepID=UPI0018E247BB
DPSCRVLNVLKPLQTLFRDPNEKCVAIVQSGGDKGMDQLLGVWEGENGTEFGDVTEVVERREEFYETSPYEPINFSEEFRHASIISDSTLSKARPCSEAGKPCNPCVDAAKACYLNETCRRLRSAYNIVCSKVTPPQSSALNQEPCSKKRCQKALRQFFERVSSELSYPLLFCSCLDQACAERRRRTIVPSCSHQERHKPSCLELRHTCRSDALCRSRLADFHMNCQMTSQTVTSCPYDNYIGCLMSYIGLIGSDVTPNYSDNSPTNITISLWCTCRGKGHQEPDCEAFHRDFTHNTCLSKSTFYSAK